MVVELEHVFNTFPFLIKIDDQETVYKLAKKRCLSAFAGELSLTANTAEVVAIHQNNFKMSADRFETFRRYSEAPANGGRNVQRRWFVCSGTGQVQKIFAYGFGYEELTKGEFGLGVYLSGDEQLASYASSVKPDEYGFKYAVQCGVLPGTCEQVVRGSSQSHPTSTKFDSGVDDLTCPKQWVMWATSMNIRIFPFLVVTFRTSTCSPKGEKPLMSISKLIDALSLALPADAVTVVGAKFKEYQERKIKKDELIRLLKQLAGERLLKSIIKSCAKEHNP